MTRETIKGLLVAAGLALLLAAGVVLPLYAAPLSHPTQPQEAEEVTLEVTAVPTTVTAGQSLTLTATIRNNQPVSITNVNLEFILPLATITSTTPLTQHWASIEPTTTVTHPVLLRVPDQVSGTLWFTATLQYIITEALLSSDNVEVVVVPPDAPTTLEVTVSPSPLPSPTPTEALVPTSAPTEAPAPTIPPPPTPAPTPTSIIGITTLTENWRLLGGGCLILLLLTLGLLLVLWAFRRKKTRATPTPTTAPPPPAPAAPYLESIGIAGSPHRFDLGPDGITIGRAPENDLVITQDFPGWETVSRSHARVYRQAGRWIIEDLDSTNGVYVNERRTGRNLLRDGWRLGIGEVEFVFRTGTGEA